LICEDNKSRIESERERERIAGEKFQQIKEDLRLQPCTQNQEQERMNGLGVQVGKHQKSGEKFLGES
jgi:hypothetical protein